MVNESLYRQCPAGTFSYQIRPGDTIAAIAPRFNTTIAAILAANPGIVPERLSIGQRICIPGAQPPGSGAPSCPIGTSPYEIERGDTLASIARRFGTTVEAILTANPSIVPERLSIGQVICVAQEKPEQVCPSLNSYVIRRGDTLGAIASAFNVTLQALLNANPGIIPQALYLGQIICIPVAPIPLSITVSVRAKLLTLYRSGIMFKAYPVATGKLTTPTPNGNFTIVNKQVNPGGPFGTRWMGLSKPHYGIHGTNNPASIGTAASNGCVRMFNQDVEDLFSYVGVGVVVRIF
ncbi:MAG: LysM peptidoglycan-binding domain-containing protein [Clostridiaceae bacterium]|jgi:lipoprotein-anchoring transpeptidase ErfK/SrfK|nr:LysM peptidoglycan-binding domain-containing protein [Clostridiaceae bacterium]